ncbi:uncharacterized protein Dwil_GK17079 [Drosophila willistoni]|uniref:Uncharacterized protein n=1 Tax=Drosophila willistoni TaxID=7260 RepID=B4MNB3_DROWI|nr:uncharacterized protein LOC6639190 [Drosophila willistoni]EDW72622.1 uncharacterized protein Dwil_GK17079 [Drosophila willistoni]
MLKIPNLRRKPLPSQEPHVIKIERPMPGKKISLLKSSNIQPQPMKTKAEQDQNVANELNRRLQLLHERVNEWKAVRKN